MEEISFKGENYVKASVLADKYGYTADYIGQLCRAGQVKATLVGRSWYVNEQSILEHRKGRYRSTLAKSKEMVRKLAEERVHQQTPINVKRIVRYETDDRELLPALNRPDETRGVLARSYEAVDSYETSIEEGSSEESEVISVPITRYERPPVRTIPAFAASETRSRKVVGPTVRTVDLLHAVPTRRTSWVPALIVTFFLLTEMAAVFIALGLEKKLTVTADGQEVTVYQFEPELMATAIRSVWED